MIKIIKIEETTIGQGDAGRYEFYDVTGVIESGDKVHRVTTEGIEGKDYIHFKHKVNAEQFIASNK